MTTPGVRRLGAVPALSAWLGLSTLVGALGCGASPVVRAARSGDLAAFRATLAERPGEPLERDEARAVAASLLASEVRSAEGLAAKRSFAPLGPCAAELDDALAQRARGQDEPAALAALLRADAGAVSAGYYASGSHAGRLTSDIAAWRAAAARSLTLAEPEDDARGEGAEQRRRVATWRRKLMLDPSAVVRQAAFRAAAEARDVGDEDDLLDAARLDPDATARRLAIHAAGAVGTERLVLALKDIWEGAGAEERVAVVYAWAHASRAPERGDAEPGCASASGGGLVVPRQPPPHCLAAEQLLRLVRVEAGQPSVIAALELIHDADPQAPTAEQSAAAALLERTIDDNAASVTVLAIEGVPLAFPDLRAAVRDAEGAADPAIAAAALARRLELEPSAPDALARTRELAKAQGPAADISKRALIASRDGEVLALLDADASGWNVAAKRQAAIGFFRLGRYRRAVEMLGDDDERVRAEVGCAILHAD